MKKDLLEKVLNEKAENFTQEYVEIEFEKCYMLVQKIMKKELKENGER